MQLFINKGTKIHVHFTNKSNNYSPEKVIMTKMIKIHFSLHVFPQIFTFWMKKKEVKRKEKRFPLPMRICGNLFTKISLIG